MAIQVAVTVRAPRDRVWQVVTDIENAERAVSAIERIEILERPATGLVGLKWRETRTMFGKPATEVMWITAADDGTFYETEARSHGSIYRTRVTIQEEGGSVRLGMEFRNDPQSFGARVAALVLGPVMSRAIQKALLQDLEDSKRVAEAGLDPGAHQPTDC